MQVHPSLGMPLQLASSPRIQESRAAGDTAPTQAENAPLTQVLVPKEQTPTSVGEPHCWMRPSTQAQPSFGTPSQSVSSPAMAHESAEPGATAPSQLLQSLVLPPASVLGLHVRVPGLQTPTPSKPGCWSHVSIVPTTQRQMSSTVLSARPSQSLSRSDAQSRGPVGMQDRVVPASAVPHPSTPASALTR